MNKKAKLLCHGAAIAALYVLLTLLSRVFGLDSGAVQLRFSEALCVLPYFTSAAVPGVFIGCLLSNLILGGTIWDIIFGSIATLIGAFFARMLRKSPWLVPLPTVLSNMLIIPPVLMFSYGAAESYLFLLATIGIGEILSVYGLGMMLLFALKKRNIF